MLPVVIGTMDACSQQNQGLYRPGSSILHLLDPRVKLLLLVLLIVSLFAAPGSVRLSVLAVVALSGVWTCRIPLQQVAGKLWSLRWLLLFGLLIHLFFTPGRTLFGTSWLSYDGLLRGLTLDLQLILALIFSYLLAVSTSPTALSVGLSRLLAPLEPVGVPVRESGGLLLLVMHFLPLVRSEAAQIQQHQPCSGLFDRVRTLVAMVGPLLVRLVDRADALAHEIVERGSIADDMSEDWSAQLNPLDWGMLIGSVPLLVLLWTF